MQSIFSGVYGVEAGDVPEVSLGSGFSLRRTDDYLLSARWAHFMTGKEFETAAEVSRYLVYTHDGPAHPTTTCLQVKDIFFSGLTALQILKPVKTLGITFYGQHHDFSDEPSGKFSLQSIERRPPMEPGPWAWKKRFDAEMLKQLPPTIESILRIMRGSNAELRNAIILLQLGLEHFHLLVAGLLWVMGLEAIFDSGGREEFNK